MTDCLLENHHQQPPRALTSKLFKSVVEMKSKLCYAVECYNFLEKFTQLTNTTDLYLEQNEVVVSF